MIRRPPRSTQGVSSAASDVYKRQDRSLESHSNVSLSLAKLKKLEERNWSLTDLKDKTTVSKSQMSSGILRKTLATIEGPTPKLPNSSLTLPTIRTFSPKEGRYTTTLATLENAGQKTLYTPCTLR
eukprot:TRINITY_DN5096_c0_g1_i2.p3 TRINITY_DN5096_c0_g1~~TRINITY_DN5096_c0_g1_i2.p3  ORF type:complete len:126 (+),score=20.68 TRINITY_DN5096_c0_g1_i2:82-459(+)